MIHISLKSLGGKTEGVAVKTEGFDLKMIIDFHGDGHLSRPHGHLHNLI